MPARDHVRSDAAGGEPDEERDHRRGLARAAGGEVADADHRHADARAAAPRASRRRVTEVHSAASGASSRAASPGPCRRVAPEARRPHQPLRSRQAPIAAITVSVTAAPSLTTSQAAEAIVRGAVGRHRRDQGLGELVLAPDERRGVGDGEAAVGVDEVAHVRPVEDGAAEERRLEGVVPADVDERAADEGDGGDAVPEPHLAEGVGEIDVGVGADLLALRALGDGEPASAQHLGERVAAVRVPRREDEREHRQRPPRPGVGGERDLLLAGMGRGREPDRASGEGAGEALALALVVGQGRRALLERALDRDPRRLGPEELELLRGEVVLGEDALEAREERARDARRTMRQRRKLRSEMRALMSSIGMPRSQVSQSIAGQISLSVHTATSGRQWSRKRRTHGTTSSGTNWWMQFSGSRSATKCAEVTVTVVTRQVSVGRACCSRRKSSSSDAASPTLAAWNQTSWPSGRGWPAIAHALAEALGVLLALAPAPLEDAPRDAAAAARGREVEAEQDRARRRLAARARRRLGRWLRRGTRPAQPSFSVGLPALPSSLSRCRWAMK